MGPLEEGEEERGLGVPKGLGGIKSFLDVFYKLGKVILDGIGLLVL